MKAATGVSTRGLRLVSAAQSRRASLRDDIELLVRRGHSLAEAAAAVGVPIRTARRWMA